MELDNPTERERGRELEKQGGVWIQITPEKSFPARRESISVDGEWKNHLGQCAVVFNAVTSIDTNRSLYNCDDGLAAKQGTVDHNAAHTSNGLSSSCGDLEEINNGAESCIDGEEKSCGFMGCGNSSMGVPKLGFLDNLTFMELLALGSQSTPPMVANTSAIATPTPTPQCSTAVDGMAGSVINTQSSVFGDHDHSFNNNANNNPATQIPHYDDRPDQDQEKYKDEAPCEGENSQSAPPPTPTQTHRRKKLHRGLNLNKKPQRRPKKKKYWPKIAVEGKARKVPKSRKPMSSTPPTPKTPNQSTPKRATKKTKNLRKKNLEVAANPGEAIDPKLAAGHEHEHEHEHAAKKSCRRVLNFILEAHAREINDSSNRATREVTAEQNVTNQRGGCRYNPLRVYHRVFIADKCPRNSKLLGPNFPRIFKKRRMETKRSIMPWGQRIANHVINLERRLFIKMILPTQLQRTTAFLDPESFQCIFSLIPAAKYKRRRSPAKGIDNNEHQSSAVTKNPNAGTNLPSTPDKNTNAGSKLPSTPEKNPNAGSKLPSTPEKNPNGGTKLPSTPEKNTNGGSKLPSTPEKNPNGGSKLPSTPEKNTTGGSKLPFTPETPPAGSKNPGDSKLSSGSKNPTPERYQPPGSKKRYQPPGNKNSPQRYHHPNDSRKLPVTPDGYQRPNDGSKFRMVTYHAPNGDVLVTRESTKDRVASILHRLELASVIEGLGSLCINDEGDKQLVVRDRNAHFSHSGHGALVPYDEGHLKKRKVLPKVDLDPQTMRVWKMLMENDGSEGVEEEDEDKEKCWEEQRKVFRGRVYSFINRMNDIQGNRTFSRWKGSVVDSVVGVFLTQNVSDHLSSSAFMSLAARFPLRSTSNHRDNHRAEEACDPNPSVSSLPSETATAGQKGKLNRGQNLDSLTGVDLSATFMPCNDETSDHKINKPSCDESAIDGNGMETQKQGSNSSSCDEGAIDGNGMETQKQGSNSSSCDEGAIDGNGMETQKQGSNSSSCDESAIDGNGMETQKQGSNSSDKVFVLEGASGRLPRSDNHCSNVPLAPSDMEIDCLGLLGGFKNINTGDISNNLGTGDTYASLDKCQLPRESSFQTEVEKEEILHPSNNHRGKNKMNLQSESTLRTKKSKVEEKLEKPINWDDLRKTYSIARETTIDSMDSLDWEAVRRATVGELAKTIVERGMNNVLAVRIKEFLDRVVRDHGTLNLEWLRDVPPEKAKEYLLSIEGLGLKSVECVRLLSLHHHAFPVDTNVGRVAVRLGWVPLQPLPEALQIHLLDQYPLLNSIQKYLWPRLCTLDQLTLYELHYQMITFGKVFCTKRSPNCNACPLKGECRHFASAFASARLALPGLQKTSNVNPSVPVAYAQNPVVCITPITGSLPEENLLESRYQSKDCEPIIEIPASPEPEYTDTLERDIEDLFCESEDEIPTIRLNTEEFRVNLLDYMDKNNISLPEENMSKALVALTSEAASMTMPTMTIPKMKYISRLRTMHQVYALPDWHPLLAGLDKRDPDDPNPYLLAIWPSGETVNSSEPPKKQSDSQESELCNVNTCSSCSSCDVCDIIEEDSLTVPGTILIPCRTATRGSFPLNGTYFQVNEVFADDESSHKPIDVPRVWLKDLDLRGLCCGTSATTILRGFSTLDIQRVFWKGFICVRAFNRTTRVPRRLANRFHKSTTEIAKTKMTDE